MRGYVLGIGGLFLAIASRAYVYGNDPFDQLMEVLKTAVLPVVTLVLGYYSASSARSNR